MLEGVESTFEPTSLVVEEPQVVVHRSHEPDSIAHLRDADILTGEHVLKLIFWRLKQIRRHWLTVMVRSWNGYSRSSRPRCGRGEGIPNAALTCVRLEFAGPGIR